MVEIEKLVNIQNGNWSRMLKKDIDLVANKDCCGHQIKICYRTVVGVLRTSSTGIPVFAEYLAGGSPCRSLGAHQ
jgi:hypothetical protein